MFNTISRHCFKALIHAGIEDEASGNYDSAFDAWEARLCGNGFNQTVREEIIQIGSMTCKSVFVAAWGVNAEPTMS